MAMLEFAIPFADLSRADLIVDRLYDGGVAGSAADDPIARLLPVGNQGGFRYRGSARPGALRLVVLYTTGAELDWPDHLDLTTGVFTYYGDNRRPGRDLHDTPRSGNAILRDTFDLTNGEATSRQAVPPFLLFEKRAPGRRVQFRGLLAPGAAAATADDELVAIWRSTRGQRFQNYRARFTVLDAPTVTRVWLDDILAGNAHGSPHCPPAWTRWIRGRAYQPLTAPPTTQIRSKTEQLPADAAGRALLAQIRSHYAGREHGFERCAIGIWRLVAPSTGRCDLTRPSRDGGRDAVGEYTVGPPADPITISFALEAKCYADTNPVGVRDVARLISRLRHRQFGVFITTSYVNSQAYTEIRTDQHPIVLITGADIVSSLRAHGYTNHDALARWLHSMDAIT